MFEDETRDQFVYVTQFPFFEKLARYMGYASAIYELGRVCNSCEYDLTAVSLMGSFIWSETPQGASYWATAYNRMLDPEDAENCVEDDIEEGFESDTDLSFPNFNFKIRNGNDPLIRKWLKDNGLTWASGDDLETYSTEDHLLSCYVTEGAVSHFSDFQDLFEECSLPEVVTKVVTTLDWELADSGDRYRQERIKELQEELDRLLGES